MLSISLDGDEFSNSYRIDHNGAPTFHKVVENVNYIKENFPLYYENNVNFNAVFHNRNTLPNILSFFKQIFAKTPMIGRINDGGIHPEKKDLFNKMYLNTSSFDYTNATIEDIIEKPFLIQNHTMFLHNNLFSIYRDYLILLSENKDSEIYPTATCSPLKKRIFLTVNGKILPCEKVGHNHSLGNVSNGVTDIDFEEFAQKINNMYEMIYNKQCITCDLVSNCSICMFQCDLNCPVKGDGSDYFQSEMDFFELQPDLFNELVTKVILR
jgi:uncharacterized protein